MREAQKFKLSRVRLKEQLGNRLFAKQIQAARYYPRHLKLRAGVSRQLRRLVAAFLASLCVVCIALAGVSQIDFTADEKTELGKQEKPVRGSRYFWNLSTHSLGTLKILITYQSLASPL